MGQSLNALIEEYKVVLQTSELAKSTIRNKKTTLNMFSRWAEENALTDISAIKARHMRAFFLYRQQQGTGRGVREQNYIHLNVFFKWVKREHKKAIKNNPMAKVQKPDYKPPLVTFPDIDVIDQMIDTCDDSFAGRRDRLLLLLYKQTGGRATEITQLDVLDVDQEEQVIYIRHGKGGKTREVPYGTETTIAFTQYLIARKEHNYAHLSRLFLGIRGAFGYGGVSKMFRTRSLMVGDQPLKPHSFRHAFVHRAKQMGVTEDALMELMGWSSRAMLDRYARSMRKERAHEEYRKKMQSKEE